MRMCLSLRWASTRNLNCCWKSRIVKYRLRSILVLRKSYGLRNKPKSKKVCNCPFENETSFISDDKSLKWNRNVWVQIFECLAVIFFSYFLISERQERTFYLVVASLLALYCYCRLLSSVTCVQCLREDTKFVSSIWLKNWIIVSFLAVLPISAFR